MQNNGSYDYNINAFILQHFAISAGWSRATLFTQRYVSPVFSNIKDEPPLKGYKMNLWFAVIW